MIAYKRLFIDTSRNFHVTLSPRSLLRSDPLQPLPACGIPDLDMQPTRGRAATEGDAAPTDDIAKHDWLN